MPLQIVRQDITKMRVDAIVNTTNEEMIGYSGVDLAVHSVAGKEMDEECASLFPLALGKAKISGAYRLPCKYVIHTSGPIWRGGSYGESAILRSCYTESLKLAVRHGCSSVAFPLISSGVYGYPKDRVLQLAVETIAEFLFRHELTVYLCVFDKESYAFSQKLFRDIQEFIDDAYAEEYGDEYYYSFSGDPEDGAPCMQTEAAPMEAPSVSEKSRCFAREQSLADYLKEMDRGFREMLFDLIDESGMSDVECYKKANVDKRTFSKIKSNPNYKPSKQTAVAFAISLHLGMEQTQALLGTAGFTLSRSKPFDMIILYFIHHGNYDIFEINQALFEFDQPLLGTF